MSALVDLLRREEGLRLKVYDDATGKPVSQGDKLVGHPTIGYGRALNRKGITEAEAEYLLENDLIEVQQQVRQALPWSATLSENRLVVLQAMAFQMGIGGLLGFRNTLAMIQRGDYAAAAAGMMNSLWARQTPARAGRMAEMMRRG